MDIGKLRREYRRADLRRADLEPDALAQFGLWFEQANKAEIRDVNALSLATASPQGYPTVRTVLLKYFDREGLVFFTNFDSTKSRQIGENPQVALLFDWLELDRQVVVNGTAEKISTAESIKYFLSRPRGAQLGAWVSHQSSAVSARSLLEMKFQEMKRKFTGGEVPLPSFWGGYRVRPERFEFWQGRPNRLHDRFEYTLEDGSWTIERLAP